MKVITKISKWLSVLGSLLMRVGRCMRMLGSRGKCQIKHSHHEHSETSIYTWESLDELKGDDTYEIDN